MRLLVMVHPGRSGSTVVGNMLSQHPAIRWDGEVFTRMPQNAIPYDDDGKVLWHPYIDSLMERCRKPNLGIEIKFHQIIKQKTFGEDLEEALTRLAGAFDAQFILLTRENHLERWLSGAVARETSRYHYREGEVAPRLTLPLPAAVKDHAYGLKKTEVNAWLDEVERINDVFVSAFVARGALILSYEKDILGDPGRAYRRMLDFVGLPPEKSRPKFVKTDQRPLSDRFSNFADLDRLLRPEHYARYCAADRTTQRSPELL